MAHVKLWRLARGLVVRDRAPNVLQRVRGVACVRAPSYMYIHIHT